MVNISSVNGQTGQFGQTNYSAAKAGMHGFTMALAREVARKGVTVNASRRATAETAMVMAVPDDVRDADRRRAFRSAAWASRGDRAHRGVPCRRRSGVHHRREIPVNGGLFMSF